ncbi:MAG: primosomal protein N' [Calditrichaeota bacterium]|nr:MAG: primosomal protein N' [Calditrichota bacterium]
MSGEAGEVLAAEVGVAIPVDHPLTYLVPSAMVDLVKPGVQVVVPLGNRFEPGVVFRTFSLPAVRADDLKALYDVVSPQPFLPPDLLDLLRWIADYYVCHLGEALRLVRLNQNLKKSEWEVRLAHLPEATSVGEGDAWALRLPQERWVSLKALERQLGRPVLLHQVQRLARRGILEARRTPPGRKPVFKLRSRYRAKPLEDWPEEMKRNLLEQPGRRNRGAQHLLRWLMEHPGATRQDVAGAGLSLHTLRRLLRLDVVEEIQEQIHRAQVNQFQSASSAEPLSAEQAEFVARVAPTLEGEPRYRPFLLHGITGSGKTRIYIELVRRAVDAGRQAIVLIPEIVLTPQTLARFQHHFGERVAAIHSRLSGAEKAELWQRAREGSLDVILGPRSAIFTPFPRLGLIVVDEEHESSYKQTDAVPRYNARDVALYRAYLNNIPIVLGSATPCFESIYNARQGRYQYFRLARRLNSRQLPRVQLVDLKEEWRRTGTQPLLSENLLLKIEARLLSREQVMLLQNVRGYSPFIQCHECGYIERCEQCDITLTYHYQGKLLRCHYCGFQKPAPSVCPSCKGFDILYKGVGTQKIEQAVLAHFPHARTLRMDQDTTGSKHGHARILEQFRKGEADILIGTKMIAKGLDFERVTLVGIVSADQGLNFPDFRAAEKVFQLLTQAAGRAGRGAAGGEVVIQTFNPAHPMFKLLLSHDYLGFYDLAVKSRQSLNYPPFSRLALIRILGPEEEVVVACARKISQFLFRYRNQQSFSVLGPAPAPLLKVQNQYRYHILIKAPREVDPSMRFVRRLLKEGLYKQPEIKKWPVKIQIDVDPLEVM